MNEPLQKIAPKMEVFKENTMQMRPFRIEKPARILKLLSEFYPQLKEDRHLRLLNIVRRKVETDWENEQRDAKRIITFTLKWRRIKVDGQNP